MRELTINRHKLSTVNYVLRYSVVKNEKLSNNEFTVFTFTTEVPHEITPPYKIVLVKSFGSDESSSLISREQHNQYTNPTEKEVSVDIINHNMFNITFANYELASVTNLAYSDKNAILETNDKHYYEYTNDENHIVVKSGGVEYEGVGIDDNGHEVIKFQSPIPYVDGETLVFIKNTWHLKTIEKQSGDKEEFDDENIQIYNISDNGITSSIQLSNSISFSSIDENYVAKQFLNEVTQAITPEIIDNEKRQFLPAIMQGGVLKLANTLEINLHFRSRYDLSVKEGDMKKITKNWTTTDEQIWNDFEIDYINGGLKRINNGFTDEHADELNDLGFTEDDIRFRKTKLKKSFIRLMFYSSNEPLNAELLYYSTIFFDTGKLYKTYSNIKNNRDVNGFIYPAFDENRVDEELRLSSKFVIKNKYDISNSSEGFYLYLFPNELHEENIERTIYMKVEFNHAGYGKTVPMMMPRKRSGGSNKYKIENPKVLKTVEVI